MSDFIACSDFPCLDTDKNCFLVPYAEMNPQDIRIIMISEASPADKKDYFYAPDNLFYLQTTLQAFRDAGENISTVQEILDLGIYLTTAIKCGKTQYAISTNTIKNCSELELLFEASWTTAWTFKDFGI